MKRVLVFLLCIVMVFTIFSSCGSEEEVDTSDETKESQQDDIEGELLKIKEADKLFVGMTERPTMNFKDENGELTGFDTELAKLYADKLGVEAEFVIIDWNNKYEALESGTIDCIWNGLTATDEVKENTLISEPYAKDAQVIVMPKDKLADYPDVDSVLELSFAVVDGSVASEAAMAFGFNVVSAVQDQETALSKVALGSVDACIIDIATAIKLTTVGSEYAEYGYTVELSPEEYVVAFRKDSNLADDFNAFIKIDEVKDSLNKLAEKYQLSPMEQFLNIKRCPIWTPFIFKY